jgi:hypothetical protein
VVVDNKNTSKALLSRKSFNYQVHFIPNQDIVSKVVPIEVLRES